MNVTAACLSSSKLSDYCAQSNRFKYQQRAYDPNAQVTRSMDTRNRNHTLVLDRKFKGLDHNLWNEPSKLI